MKKDFKEWFKSFRDSICDYKYYVDYYKVYNNVENVKVKLNILNSLIGSKNIELDFKKIIKDYPETLECIPILLAVRSNEIYATDSIEGKTYNFKKMNCSINDYIVFMQKTGLFELISERIINNLIDYVTGVEVGLDSNGRKNRGGHLMENLVHRHIQKTGLKRNEDYFKEMYLSDIESKWGLDLSAISNQGKMKKRFDFVVKTAKTVFAIETNFYACSGSKLNETARSYKTIALEAKDIKGFDFVWFTDGLGWKSAKNNLEEAFDVMENIYCIKDLENGILYSLFENENEE